MINKRILKTGALAAAMTVIFAIFAFRAAEWTKGLNSEFIVYGQSGSNTGGTGGTGSTGGSTTKVIPQIAAGAYDKFTYYVTVIEVVNANTSAVTLNGSFYDDKGNPSTLLFSTNMTSQPTIGSTFSNLTVPAGSILVLTTGTFSTSAHTTGTTVWGTITGSNNISVSSFFELRDSSADALYSRVGVPASLPNMTSFLIPRIRLTGSPVTATAAATSSIDTGFALVNTGTKTATVTGKIIDVNGNVIGSTSILLPPNGHTAAFVSSSFTLLGTEASTRQYQYVLFTSDQPTIGAAGLSIEGGSVSSFPVTPLS